MPAVTALLNNYLKKFAVAPVFDEEETRHHLSMRDGVVYWYVVEDPTSRQNHQFRVVLLLPSTVIKSSGGHSTLRAAYSYYNVAGKADLTRLMEDALILARQKDFDVFNCLDLMDNAQFLKDLKFGIGDGNLQYYLYNWRLHNKLEPGDIGLVLT